MCGDTHSSIYLACYRCRLHERVCSVSGCEAVFYARHKSHETRCPTHDAVETVCKDCGAAMYARPDRGYPWCARCFNHAGIGDAVCERCNEPMSAASVYTFCEHCRFVTNVCAQCTGLFRQQRGESEWHTKCGKCRLWDVTRECKDCGAAYCPATMYATKERCKRCARKSRREKRKCDNCRRAFTAWKASDHDSCKKCIRLRRVCREPGCGVHTYVSERYANTTWAGICCATHAPAPRECSRCEDGVIPYGEEWEHGYKTCVECRTRKSPGDTRARLSAAAARRAQRVRDASTADKVTAEQRAVIRSGMCVYCGAPGEHADHIRPLYRGGHDRIENLVAACKVCNAFKHTLTLIELEEVRRDLVIHACLVSPLVLAEYAREKLGGTLNGPELTPLKTPLTRTKPGKRYSYNPPPTPDLTAAWRLHAAIT
ncbi:HNH endonuclease [Mycobacteroides abscessus subsp. abscessus]|nr:HNH endonuclease [Mycobacteroides abscessus subsp. abscessus]